MMARHMDPEINTIVQDMKKHCKEDPIANSEKQTYLMVQSSRLSVLLAEEAETQNKKVAKQTKKKLLASLGQYIYLQGFFSS